jgi:hypothetical protein
MENAVKALIMVAGLIIGVLVIGLLVYLFRIGGNVASNYEQSMSEGEIASFNAKFEKYITQLTTNPEANSGANNGYSNLFIQQSNNIHDIVSVINLAYDVNAQLKSSNSTDGLQVVLHADIDYYMNAQILSDYYEKTKAWPQDKKRRQKNIVFTKENPQQNYNNNDGSDEIKELDDLVKQYNDSVLYNNGKYNQRIYKTYFDCTESLYSERGRLYKLVFTLVDTKTKLENDNLDANILAEIGL